MLISQDLNRDVTGSLLLIDKEVVAGKGRHMALIYVNYNHKEGSFTPSACGGHDGKQGY